MDPQFELEALKYVDGPLYTKHRDAWLASTPDAREIVRRQEQQRDWRTRVTAKILLTWLDHRPEAEKLLEDVDHADWERVRPTVVGDVAIPQGYSDWSAKHPEVHGWLFPLCWEVMLKRYKEWPHDKRWVFLWMLRADASAVLNELTLEVSFWYLRTIAETTEDRTLGTYGLADMPTALLGPHVRSLQGQERDLAALFKGDFPRLFPERPR